MVERRPFHETLFNAIRIASVEELIILGTLIKVTKIPKNHDNIIMAWDQRRDELGITGDDPDVSASLMEQKRESENPPEMTHEEKVKEALDRR